MLYFLSLLDTVSFSFQIVCFCFARLSSIFLLECVKAQDDLVHKLRKGNAMGSCKGKATSGQVERRLWKAVILS